MCVNVVHIWKLYIDRTWKLGKYMQCLRSLRSGRSFYSQNEYQYFLSNKILSCFRNSIKKNLFRLLRLFEQMKFLSSSEHETSFSLLNNYCVERWRDVTGRNQISQPCQIIDPGKKCLIFPGLRDIGFKIIIIL